MGRAQWLAGGGAVHVGNEVVGRILKGFHEFVPGRLHLLAVASPRRQELDEHGLAGHLGVPIVGRELDGGGGSKEREKESERRDLHRHGCSGLRVVVLFL